jgi:hypothetical protein
MEGIFPRQSLTSTVSRLWLADQDSAELVSLESTLAKQARLLKGDGDDRRMV